MISHIEEIPITPASYPFSSAERYCELSKRGYVEREYYIQGTANVYRSISNGPLVEIRTSDAPYINRCIVRTPTDPGAASGNVVVEIINPTSFMEIERMWILGHREFLRSGDIYVGITSKPNTIAKLIEFDGKRYGRLSWANPTPDVPFTFDPDELIRSGVAQPDLDPRYETGLFWDMLIDLARVLRSDAPQNPIRDFRRDLICLSGWSQSGSYLLRYINSFAEMADSGPEGQVFDAYLAGGAVHSLVVPVNQYESGRSYAPELRRVERCRQPLIAVQTESENGRMQGWRTYIDDSDRSDFRYRCYEVAGASHDTRYTYVDYYRDDEDLKRIDHLPAYTGKHAHPNDYPSEILIAAAFRNLFRWVRTGAGPTRCPRIPVDAYGENIRDAFGNSIGGLRTCLLDYPCARFCNTSRVEIGQGTVDKNSTVDGLFGHREPFSQNMLIELYGTLDHYRELCEQSTREQVSRGFVCKEDADALVEAAVRAAVAGGLV
ncbi:hypothetical protein Corgl_1617 [Coriobacterium glomerans PW2]|uniref:Alpha/beta hydrolase domain-containing protein n=1 Tax=Coriobacterium glomerans (strain ATCC 49209 / DSM 20642 / JCM 10262 / PW2) TaxID=700015 RepID=F2N940_CORGP|nr:alpha/beta hydrolase domain-containing protein [Coriobacterium glomerans]AEB07716.1 hypothetical protein Corgl_1617 [Coriobacterium glomerans PW2]